MTLPPDKAVPVVATVLGRAGLLPFIGFPVAMIFDPFHILLWADMLSSYALVIICFLVGIWWGLALIRHSWTALVLSNAVVLMAFFGQVLLPLNGFFLLCALLFPITVFAERTHALFKLQPAYYAKLRLQLTLVATASMLSVAALL